MPDLKSLFADFYNASTEHQSLRKSSGSSVVVRTKNIDESLNSTYTPSHDNFMLQKQIRPHFGKPGINNSPSGTHPDFIDLEYSESNTKQQYVCTLFIDIKGSTRLNLLYPLEQVFLFKNAVLRSCIEIVRSFDGHVHRLMGDAIMAFFGGYNVGKENAIADTINCCITLRAILEQSIKPWMKKNGLDEKDFGFRVGCEFGDDHEILWGRYGYDDVSEVSATGLPVDMASKLQGLASKNQTMLGRGILDFINWPQKYLKIKKVEREGHSKELKVVTPNLTNSEGIPLDYQMRLLAYYNCLEFSALPRDFRAQITNSSIIDNTAIDYFCYTLVNEERSRYMSASYFLEKNVSLEFEIRANTKTRLKFPLTARFIKTNHGKDTPEEERDLEQEEKVKTLYKSRTGQYQRSIKEISKCVIKESTLYRGVHTMKCTITDNTGSIIFRDRIGVMIK